MIKRLLIVVVALGTLFGGVFGWKYLQSQKMLAAAAMPPPPAVIAADRVRRETWQPELAAIGSMVAKQGVSVASEIAGQVREIRFESGAAVAAGTLLVQLDDEVDRAELASLAAAARLAQVEFERAAKLVKDNTMSRSAYDHARATLDGASAAVAAQQARIRKKAVRAPFAGVLGIREVDLGEYLSPGTAVVSLQALAPIYADFQVPERHLGRLAVGQVVTVGVQAYPGERFDGVIAAISARLEAGTRSVQVRAVLANERRLLRPGMFAEVRIVLPAQDAVLTLPAHAVTYNPYGESVFVITEGEAGLTAQYRQIETGEVRDGRVAIRRGLKEGEQVVVAGHNKLRHGQTVTIDNSVNLDGRITGP